MTKLVREGIDDFVMKGSEVDEDNINNFVQGFDGKLFICIGFIFITKKIVLSLCEFLFDHIKVFIHLYFMYKVIAPIYRLEGWSI